MGEFVLFSCLCLGAEKHGAAPATFFCSQHKPAAVIFHIRCCLSLVCSSQGHKLSCHQLHHLEAASKPFIRVGPSAWLRRKHSDRNLLAMTRDQRSMLLILRFGASSAHRQNQQLHEGRSWSQRTDRWPEHIGPQQKGHRHLTATRVQEDLYIMQERAGGDTHLTAAAATFLQRVDFTEKLGRSLAGVHAPEPFYTEIAKPMINVFGRGLRVGRPLERFNWALTDDPALFQVSMKSTT